MDIQTTDRLPILFDDDVERFADMGQLIEIIKGVLRDQASNRLISPPRHSVEFPTGNLVFTVGGTQEVGGFRAYTTFGRILHTGVLVAGAKPDAVKDTRQIVAVWDFKTNELQGLVVGDHVSAYRAGAIGGAAVDLLAPRDARSCGVIGTGHHATTQLLAAATVRRLERVRIYSRNPDNRARFADKMSRRLNLNVIACNSAEEAVRDAEIVLCATNASTPVIEADWIAPNAYVSSLGPKFAKVTEVPAALGTRAAIIATDTPGQVEAFRNNHFLSGTADFDRIQPLNKWLDGGAAAPTSGISLFLLTGLAGTEVITAARILKSARQAGFQG